MAIKLSGNARGIHVSPGVYTREIDLTYSAKSLGITTLGLAGETVMGPAFQPMLIENWTDFQNMFGGTNPEKFKGSQYPKYELPYIAKSYLTQSQQLYVCRVLGLSGFNAGPAWAVTMNGVSENGKSNMVIAVLRSKGEYHKYLKFDGDNTVSGRCECQSRSYDTLMYTVGEKSAASCMLPRDYNMNALQIKEYVPLEDTGNECINYNGASGETSWNITASNYGRFKIVGWRGQHTSEEINEWVANKTKNDDYFEYAVTLNPNDRDYILKVLGISADEGDTPIYVESLYDVAIAQELAKTKKTLKINSGLTPYQVFYTSDYCDVEPVNDIMYMQENQLTRKNVGQRYIADSTAFTCHKFSYSSNTTADTSTTQIGQIYTVAQYTDSDRKRHYYYRYYAEDDATISALTSSSTNSTDIIPIVDKIAAVSSLTSTSDDMSYEAQMHSKKRTLVKNNADGRYYKIEGDGDIISTPSTGTQTVTSVTSYTYYEDSTKTISSETKDEVVYGVKQSAIYENVAGTLSSSTKDYVYTGTLKHSAYYVDLTNNLSSNTNDYVYSGISGYGYPSYEVNKLTGYIIDVTKLSTSSKPLSEVIVKASESISSFSMAGTASTEYSGCIITTGNMATIALTGTPGEKVSYYLHKTTENSNYAILTDSASIGNAISGSVPTYIYKDGLINADAGYFISKNSAITCNQLVVATYEYTTGLIGTETPWISKNQTSVCSVVKISYIYSTTFTNGPVGKTSTTSESSSYTCSDEVSAGTKTSTVTSTQITYTVGGNPILVPVTVDLNNYKSPYRYASTPWIVSNVKGDYDHLELNKLFRFHTISDGNASNYQVKVSIANIKPDDGVFDVIVRNINDSDSSINALEKFSKCSLVPGTSNYIGLKIGTYDGTYESKSDYITVEINENSITENSIPAGFLGYPRQNFGGEQIGEMKMYDNGAATFGNLVNPIIQYNTDFDSDIKNKRQYFGLSDIVGVDVDLFAFKGNAAYYDSPEYMTQGFHLDSRLDLNDIYGPNKEKWPTIFVDGESGYSFDAVSTNARTGLLTEQPVIDKEIEMDGSIYEYVDLRKFTVYFYGGFDGWDVFRTQRSNTDDFKKSKYNGIYSDISGEGSAFDKITDPESLGLNQAGITSDWYAYLSAIRQFANPQSIDINVFATPGIDYVNNTLLVEEAIEMIEDERGDSLYVITTPDKPSGAFDYVDEMYTADDIVYNLEDTEIDSNYSCTYYPWCKYYDSDNSQYVMLPPTRDVVRNIAMTDNVSFPWFAPAGINRGDILCTKAHYITKLGDEDTLYEGRVNPIKTFAQDGVKIWGQKTLSTTEGALNRINIRRLMLRIKKLIVRASNQLIFDPNDTTTKDKFLSLVTPILDSVKSNRGIFDYRIKVNDSVEARERLELPCVIYVKPTKALEYITIDFVLTPENVSFDSI